MVDCMLSQDPTKLFRVSFIAFLFSIFRATQGFQIPRYTRIFDQLSTFHSREVSGAALFNSNDLSYYANITIAGEAYTVLVDTGSSDLWITGSANLQQAVDTGTEVNVTYAASSVRGSIKLATVNFAGKEIKAQAFLEVLPDALEGFGIPERYGILGLGPTSSSILWKAEPLAVPLMQQIFEQNHTISNTLTLLLGRSKDQNDSFTGNITIGDVLQEFQAILTEPRLPITQVPTSKTSDQHIQIILDQNGIIGPDDVPIHLESAVQATEDKSRATVVLDCGFSLPQLPDYIVDAIYSRYKDAERVTIAGIGTAWILPCLQEVNITFRFAGQDIPIHPLDMSMELSVLGLPEMSTLEGERSCLGTFQPFTYNRGREPNYDMVLGMAFMRNVYTLVNYGSMVNSSSPNSEAPYVQFLPLTDRAEAHQDFVRIRLGGNDTTASRKGHPLNNDGSRSPDAIYYIVAGVAAVVLCLILGIVCFLRTRRKSTR